VKDRLSYPWLLAGAVLTAAALFWAVGQASGQAPKAIPVPVYKVETTYGGTGKELIETRKVVCTNMPATAAETWYRNVTPPIHVVFEGGQFWFFPWKGGPSPDPKPDPKPDPIPPVPVTELWAVIIEESAERTPAQGIVLASPKVRALFPAAGGFRLVDKDSTVDSALQPYLDRAKGQKLPVCFLVAPSGFVHYEGALPATVDATVSLVDRIKKGGK
jgi:hypothetical protein